MSEISAAELYELYLDTLERCTSDLCKLSDEEIEYNLFEEFDVGVRSFLHDESLQKLANAEVIDGRVLATSKEVRKKWLDLQEASWTIEEIKTKVKWHELFSLCDELVSKLKSADSKR